MASTPQPTDDFNPYYEWLSIPVGALIDHYRLLGVPRFEGNAKVIANAYDAKMGFLRTKQLGQYGPLSQRLQNELTAAQGVLLDPVKRAAYDKELTLPAKLPTAAAPIPVFLPLPVAQPTPIPLSQPVVMAQAIPVILPQPVQPVVVSTSNPESPAFQLRTGELKKNTDAATLALVVKVALGTLLAIPCVLGLSGFFGRAPVHMAQPATQKVGSSTGNRMSTVRPEANGSLPSVEKTVPQPSKPPPERPIVNPETKSRVPETKVAESKDPAIINPSDSPLPEMKSPPVTNAAANRTYWRYENGSFELQADGSWLQLVEGTKHLYRETEKNTAYIELEHVEGAGSIRIFPTYSELKRVGTTEYVKFKEGQWDLPRPVSLTDLPLPPTRGDKNSPARIAIDKAIAAHKKAMDDAKSKMLKTFEITMGKVTRDKTLLGSEKLRLVARLEVEQAAFEKAGYLPFSTVMRVHWPAYVELVNLADFRLREVFEKQIATAVTEAKDAEAEQLKQERDSFFKPRIIARWDDWVMYSNGKMRHHHWGVNNWTITGNRIDVGTDRFTLNSLGDSVDCVNQFNIRFGLTWRPPPD